MDDDTRSRYTRRGALALMGAGGLAVISETTGFTQISADRGVTVNVDSDQNAVLGVVGNETSGDTPLEGTEFTSPVGITITNNFAELINIGDLEIRIQNNTGGNTLTVSSEKFSRTDSGSTLPADLNDSNQVEAKLDNDSKIDPDGVVALTLENKSNNKINAVFEILSASVNGTVIRDAVRSFSINS